MSIFIHPSANVESGVTIGEHSAIWDNVHVRHDTIIGSRCIIGEKAHVSYNVKIGDLVKINAFVYICTGVTIEDGVMVSAGCIFTNDRYPRAADAELVNPLSSDPGEKTLSTTVRAGATLGAGCIIGCGLTIGRFAMVGMGSVVTRPVPDFHLVVGNPARSVGYVCRCGEPLARGREHLTAEAYICDCDVCSRNYRVEGGVVSEMPMPTLAAL
jgi:UDP-2-acetamido-3-amino-2,3-dideoxy-glucuronate N-acetyltransferase